MKPIGAHMSIAGGLAKAFQRIRIVGGECLQIFVKPNVQWEAGDLTLDEVIWFKEEQQRAQVAPVVAHASYLLNLASPDSLLRKKSILTLALELVRSARLGIPYLIIHPGSHLGTGEGKGIKRIAQGLDQAFNRAGVETTMILLETTAGSGSQLGSRLEHLRDILAQSRAPQRLGVCVDTSHVFAAGYDIANLNGYEDFLAAFRKLIGMRRLKVIHANDSKVPLGAKVDRHQQIGLGHLGTKTFQRLLADPRLDGRPFILETPKGKNGETDWDVINIALLKKFRKKPDPQRVLAELSLKPVSLKNFRRDRP